MLRGVSVDITAQRLEEQRRTQALGQLAGGFAHEFNNRLTVIQAGLELASDAALAPDLGELMREARIAAERCASLTREVLTFAQRQVLQPRPVVLNEVLGSASSALADLLGDAVELELALAPDLWTCNVDTAELTTAVGNLVRNAREAMPTGGELTIRVAADGAVARLIVTDSGVGMDAVTVARIFEPFFTTKASGTGLGLATVRDIVARSGGTIAVRSAPGAGTTFTIELPRVAEASTPTVAPPAPSAAPAGPARRVLLVEDDVLVRRGLVRWLERDGFEVVAVADGVEALALVGASRRFACVVSDVAMPQLDGSALAERLAETHPELPVLLVSGNRRPPVSTGGARRAFLEKPLEPAALRRAIDDLTA